MYVRTIKRKNKDGSTVEYIQLAHNVWNSEKGFAQAQVLYSFGRREQLDVDAIRRLISSLCRFLDPEDEVSAKAKEALINKVFAQDKITRNLVKLVVANGRIGEISNIAESFHAVLSESAGVATARIESATSLDEKQVNDLAAALKKMTGKEVTVEVAENSKLLGGIRVHLGDEMIDLSLARKIENLSKALS